LTNEIATEIGDNWSVFFFECPANSINEVLVDLFRYIRKIKEARIPHFMIREFAITQHFGISLRVLRSQDNADIVEGKLTEFFEQQGLRYQSNPEDNRHAWIRKGGTNARWNRKRCEALHQLSNLVVFLAKNDFFSANDRCHMAHYTINMLGLQEATVPNSNQVSLLDIISGQALSFQTYQLRPA
jgi:hypothetical protein